jgi:NADH:ubiquinone oxidoreductase subunit 2 (subunit N)
MFMEQPLGQPALSSSRPLAVGLLVMVVATLLLGLFPNVLLKFAEASARLL